MDDAVTIIALFERLARLHAAEHWQGDLNPVQHLALSYLGQANRFSRKPSQVAEFLSATRGTVSQTLKVLIKKGLVAEQPSESDRRTLHLNLTEAGWRILQRPDPLGVAARALPPATADAIHQGLKALLQAVIGANQGRSFGVCSTCIHHRAEAGTLSCALLRLPLGPEEADQICFEHAA